MNRFVLSWLVVLMSSGMYLLGGVKNLLANPSLKEHGPKMYPGWTLVRGQVFHHDNHIQLRPQGEQGALLFQPLNLAPDKAYVLDYEVMSPNQASGAIYAEGMYPSSGKMTYRVVTPRRPPFSSSWQYRRQEFHLPPGWKSFYVGVKTSGSGIVCFRNMRLHQVSSSGADSASNLLKNHLLHTDDTHVVDSWTLVSGTVSNRSDHAEISPSSRGGSLLFQCVKPLPDRDYFLEYEYSSPNGARSMIYAEAVYPDPSGKERYRGFCSRKAPPGTSWTFHRDRICVPAGWKRFYIAINTKSSGIVRVRKLRFVPAPPAPGALGGTWSVSSPHMLDGGKLLLKGRCEQGVVLRGIPVTPGKQYRIDYAAEGVSAVSVSSHAMHLFGTRVEPELSGGVQFMDLGDFACQRKFHRFLVPEGSGLSRINLHFSMKTNGSVRFSDFSIREIPVDPTSAYDVELTAPGYRGIFFGTESSHVEGVLHGDVSVSEAMVGFQGQKAYRIGLQEGKASFRIPCGGSYGSYQLKVRFLDRSGHQLASRAMTLLRVPDFKHKVTVVDGKRLLVDGKPYFPLVMWLSGRGVFDESQLAYLAGNGVNTVLVGPWSRKAEVYRYMLDQAQRSGLKLIMRVPVTPTTMEDMERFKTEARKILIPGIIRHPSFMGYFLCDEPLWSGLPAAPLQSAYRFLREQDPYHPVYINAAPRYTVEDLRPYGEACDIYGVDIYPIPYPNDHSDLPDKTPSCVGKYTLRMREVVGDRKPIFMVQQAFAWHECSGSKVPEKPHPTASELRFMALDALVNGGVGYSLWGFTHVRKPDFVPVLMKACREIHQLSGLFSLGHSLGNHRLSDSQVRIAIWGHGDKRYYIALNVSPEVQERSVSLPLKSVRYYLEEEDVSLVGGQLRLRLAPYTGVVFGGSALPASGPPLAAWRSDHPFREDIRKRQSRFLIQPYRGRANWIWDSARIQADATCRLGMSFEVGDTSCQARLAIAADDRASIYVNGHLAGSTTEWNSMRVYSVSKYLKHGKNLLVVEAQDSGVLPCAVLAELQVGDKIYVSDTGWKALPLEGPIPSDASAIVNCPTAVIIAPFGQAPWGRDIKLITGDSQ